MACGKRRRLGSVAGSRWLCWSRLVMVPWLVRAIATRTFESFYELESFYVGSGSGKYWKPVRRCTGWDEPSWEWPSREDCTTADACWANEYGPIVSTRIVMTVRRAVGWAFEWRRRKSATRCDED
jgi:hypothetical protein